MQLQSSHIPLIFGKGQKRHELQEASTSYIFRRYFGEQVCIILVTCIPKLKAVSLQGGVKIIQSHLEKVEDELPHMIFKGSLVLNDPVSCSAISKESTFSGPEIDLKEQRKDGCQSSFSSKGSSCNFPGKEARNNNRSVDLLPFSLNIF